LISLQDLSGLRLIQSDDRLMVVEMQPPKQAVSNVVRQDASEILVSSSSSASELSKLLRVTITFADNDKVSPAKIQVINCHVCASLLHFSEMCVYSEKYMFNFKFVKSIY